MEIHDSSIIEEALIENSTIKYDDLLQCRAFSQLRLQPICDTKEISEERWIETVQKTQWDK